MSGIVGLFNRDGRPVTVSDLETLATASRHRASGGQRLRVSSCFGLGHQQGGATPAWTTGERPVVSTREIAAALDGRIDAGPERARAATFSGLQGSSHSTAGGDLDDAAWVLGAYQQSGDHFATSLTGDFAIAVVDPVRRQVVLARDIMGPRRLHYTEVGRTLLFASEIKSLLAFPGVAAVCDDDALADIVLDRWVDGDRTGFKGIHSVPPGHTVVVTADAISVHQHWAFDPAREVRYSTDREYIDRFRELFEQSVRRRMRTSKSIAIAVSGGVDSSLIFCQALVLERQGSGLPPVHGISTTFRSGGASDEKAFLSVLETSCGRPITRLPLASISLMSHAAACIEQAEMPALVWSPQNQLLDEARSLGCSVVLDGYFGDQVLFPRTYLVELARRGRWPKVRRDLREFAGWTTDAPEGYPEEFWGRLFRSSIPRPVFQAVKKHARRRRTARYPAWYAKPFVNRVIERQLARFHSTGGHARSHAAECYQQATAGHYLFQVQRQTAEALTRGLEAAHPFRDRDLVAFLMAIPGDVVNRGGVPKAIAREACTDILPPSIRDRRWKADVTGETNQAALNDYGTITSLLTRSSAVVARGFADAAVIEPGVRACRSAIEEHPTNAEAVWSLSQLVGLELWLRRYCGAEGSCTTS